MLTFELAETDKHSTKILLRRKNLRFSSRTNHIKARWQQAEEKPEHTIKIWLKRIIFKYNLTTWI